MEKTPLYLRESEFPITQYRKQLIKLFLQNKGYNTYSDEKCKNLQCEKGRFRSITELYQIVLGRFPKTSFNGICQIIKELIDEENGRVVMVWCNQVNKVVLKYISESESKYISDYSRKNYYNQQGVDGYSLEQYEQIFNKLNK